MSAIRRKKHKTTTINQRLKKWGWKLCQRIRAKTLVHKQPMQIHFLRNPTRSEEGICVEYSSCNVFYVSTKGEIRLMGKVAILEGSNENIIAQIMHNEAELA